MLTTIIGLLGGIFCLWAAYTRQEWFFKSSRAWLFVKLFGEDGARIFYMILGGFLIVLSLILLGIG